jgi:hypothetical protein
VGESGGERGSGYGWHAVLFVGSLAFGVVG